MATPHFAADGPQDAYELMAPAAPWLVDPGAGAELMLSAVAVPWRFDQRGGFEIALVKRRRRRDWGFPKGSPLAGEDLEAAAVRELREETGLTGRHAAPLANLVFASRTGRPKLASYWLTRAEGAPFRPNREVARLEWMSPVRARAALWLERERLVLGLAAEQLGLSRLR